MASNAKKIALVINTGGGKRSYRVLDSTSLRRAALINKVPYCTNMSTAYACLEGIKSLKSKKNKRKSYSRALGLNFPISFKSYIIELQASSFFFNFFFFHAMPCIWPTYEKISVIIFVGDGFCFI